MCRLVSVSLVLLVSIVQQACQRPEVTAPQQSPEPDTSHGHAAAQLAFNTQPPAGVLANAVISPAIQVTVKDGSGDVVHGGSVTITLGAGPTAGAILSGTLEQRIVNGVATFPDLRIDQPGRDYTLQATAGPASESSRPFAIVGPPTQVALVTEPPASVEAGVVITPAVRVAIQDALGSTVPNATDTVTVVFGANPTGARLLGTTKLPAVDGLATFADLAVDRPGSGFTLAAAASSLAGATSAPFAAHVTFIAVDAGGIHSCGVSTRGAAYCWGFNLWGEVGDGTSIFPWVQTTPAPVVGGLSFTMIHAGTIHSCGLTTGGAAYCWGTGREGERGDGRDDQTLPTPSPVAGGLTFTMLEAAYYHTCGVTTLGQGYCWGGDAHGELGDGRTRTFSSTPVPVGGGLTFTTISAGGTHTCGLVPDGAGYCWGEGFDGALGDGSTDYHLVATPAPVVGGLRFTTISVGGTHTCALTAESAAYCWGHNADGQLGDGSTTSQATPVLVTGGQRFTTIRTFGDHTCGITPTGAAYCWGANGTGQLGDGTTTSRAMPTLVAGGLTFRAIGPGSGHTCGVTTSGEAYCWGSNGNGELGNGTRTPSPNPVPVAPGKASSTALAGLR